MDGRFGVGRAAEFQDAVSGCVFRFGEPAAWPELWERCLAGVLAAYRSFGVEAAVEYPGVRDGRTTSYFAVAMDPRGEVVGGARVLWPYRRLDDVHALRAWAGRPGEQEFRDALAARFADGIVELKAGWTDRGRRLPGLSAALSRCMAHGAWLHGVRYSLLTSSDHSLTRYLDAGAEVAANVSPVPYPDERYKTVPLWWDLLSYRETALPDQAALIDDERAQLIRSATETTSRGGL
ncbi:hypothetical protein EDD29_2756 [Actinocorallia herbida]|uniref:GNAT family N-acetyltransferase n=1 Tax=Actinocorallia herbida TaxID=58109 RepID=A0A3N1CVA4_9ACTN|nr:hypothetical protein [Actinocorallia herbida]ROO85216.1 hypothetical protein EDD29_2756 [Actinocorallia herbida]